MNNQRWILMLLLHASVIQHSFLQVQSGFMKLGRAQLKENILANMLCVEWR